MFLFFSQVLKKDLYFDPEFWNLVALRTNCLKLLSGKVVGTALEEIMEDKWISKYPTKTPALRSCAAACQRENLHVGTKRHHQEDKVHKKDSNMASKKLRMGTGKTRLNEHSLRRKSNEALKESSSRHLRRSFWQLDRIHSNLTLRYDDHRRTTRLSEKNLPKRKIKKPRWLLEDSGALEENVPLKMKKNGLRQKGHLRSCVMKSSQTGQLKDTKHKSSVKTLLKARENSKPQNGFSLDCSKPTPPPQVILELSLPDNELLDTFIDDPCNKPRMVPQVLLYKPTVKFPDTSPPGKTVHGKEVILRARDANMLVQQLHCYARRQKGKGNGSSIHGSVSTITRSSVQGSPSKDSPEELGEKPVSELNVGTMQTGKETGPQVSNKVPKDQNTKPEVQKTPSVEELSENSERTKAKKVTESPDLHSVPQPQTGNILQSSACTGNPPENSSTHMEGTTASQSLPAADVTENPHLHDVSQAQTIIPTGESFEEPAVEMKVTIASQSPVIDKSSKSSTGHDVPKFQVSQTTKAAKKKKEVSDVIHPVSISPNEAADTLHSNCQDVAVESRDRSEKESNGNNISMMDVGEDLQKTPQVNVPCKNDTSPVENVVHPHKLFETIDSCTSTDKAITSGTSALTVTDHAPKELDDDHVEDEHRTPGSRASKDSRSGSKPKVSQKIPSTSRCSVSVEPMFVADREEENVKATQDALSDITENSELMETLPEPEESKLEHYCTFCDKDFKGSRVVEHAMFHYRKDECTFCRLIFKDDLLAMMHLSDHIEKLKRCKDQENGVSVTKDTATPKSSAKAKTTNIPSGCQGKGKERKFSVCSESIININPSKSRMLRSNPKKTNDTSSHDKQRSSKHVEGNAAAHRVNGHIGKKTEITKLKRDLNLKTELVEQKSSQSKHDKMSSSRLQRNHPEGDSLVQAVKDLSSRENIKKESLQNLKKTLNQKTVEKKNTEPQEKVCCPMDGCSWFTDLSKNRVTLLYHALEKHHGEIKPLELAFRVADNKCSICMRVLFSFEHFQHHVERHRLIPRHPCLHLGCTERFKTGMEMRRHARKHSPLKAVCCLPGCSQLFICLWALNLHEREHYSSKSVKPEKDTNVQAGDKLSKKPQISENTETASGSGTECIKATHRLKEQETNNSTRKNMAGPVVPAGSRLVKNEVKLENESVDLNMLTNLSKKDASVQPPPFNLRLRQTLRKVQVTNTNRDAPKVNKIISSSLLKYRSKLGCKFRKKQINTKGLIRREHLSKVSNAAHNKKTTKRLSSQDTVNIRRVSDRIKVEKEKNRKAQEEVKTTEKTNVSKLKMSEGKQIERNLRKISSSNRLNLSAVSEKRKSNDGKAKTFHKIKNRHTPSDSGKSKKNKIAKVKISKKTVKIRQKHIPSASEKPLRSTTAVPQKSVKDSTRDEVKTEEENQNSAQTDSGSFVLVTPPTTQETVKEGEKTKISLEKKDSSENEVKTSTLKTISDLRCDSKQDKTKGAAMILQGLQRLIKSTIDEKEKRKEGSGASPPITPEKTVCKTSSSSAPEENEPKEDQNAKKSCVEKKNSESGKVGRKRKSVCKDDAKKVAKKKRHDQCEKSSTDAQPAAGEHSEGEDKNPSEMQSPPVLSACSPTPSRDGTSEDATFKPCKETLAEYGKKPYMRLPPTVYLDERFITMPKRRKELFPQRCPGGVSTEPVCVKTAQQRQRCANCFTTFNSAEELQSHLERQKCSNLFGFDSDDEGECAI